MWASLDGSEARGYARSASPAFQSKEESRYSLITATLWDEANSSLVSEPSYY